MGEKEFEDTKKYLGFELDTRNRLLLNYREEIRDFIQYVISFMSILGVFAGFGFTAYDYIPNKILFFVGEILVILSIVYLIFKTKNILAGQPSSTENWINGSMDKTNEIKKAILTQNEDEIKKLGEEFNGKILDFSSRPPKLETAGMLSRYINRAILPAIIGIIFILLSFIQPACFSTIFKIINKS